MANATLSFKRTFRGRKFFCEKNSSVIVSETSSKKFSAGVPKLHSFCPEELFEELFFEKINFVIFTFWLSEKISDFWLKFFGRVVEVAFYVSRETFWEKKDFFENTIFSREIFGLLAGKIPDEYFRFIKTFFQTWTHFVQKREHIW